MNQISPEQIGVYVIAAVIAYILWMGLGRDE